MSAPGPVVTKYPCALVADALSASIIKAIINFTEFPLAAPQALLALKGRRNNSYADYYLIQSVQRQIAMAFQFPLFNF
jgi:hypothetical protein